MADQKTMAAQPPKSETHLRYDIKNPTRAMRVIYDGIPESMKQIAIASGDTKKDVLLHSAIVKELRERNKAKPDSDLLLTLADPKDEEAA